MFKLTLIYLWANLLVPADSMGSYSDHELLEIPSISQEIELLRKQPQLYGLAGMDYVKPLSEVQKSLIRRCNVYVQPKDYTGIKIIFKRKTFLYDRGKLFFLAAHKIHAVEGRIPRTVRLLVQQLQELEKTSEQVAALVNSLATSPYEFAIDIRPIPMSYVVLPLGKSNQMGFLNNHAYAFDILLHPHKRVDYAPFEQIGSAAQIRFNPRVHDQFVLAHELFHLSEANLGLMCNRMLLINRKTFNLNELRAISFENEIRKLFQKPPRYGEIMEDFWRIASRSFEQKPDEA